MKDVAIVKCETYEFDAVKAALYEAIQESAGFDMIKEGTRVAIKANLVSSADPDTATTTHPVVLCALSELLAERGAEVVIGDSPGGLYNAAFLERVYKGTELYSCEEHGAKLNKDFSEAHAHFPEAEVAKTFTYTGYLDSADVIIDACKLKTHGMMGLSCAAKNMFGVIPGTMKPEYHFRYPSYESFANMIIDLDEYFKPVISVCDAVVGMEGNGPTAGNPRKIGCIIASASPHKLDLVAAHIIGLAPQNVPTLQAAISRGLAPKSYVDMDIYGNVDDYAISDYDNIAVRRSLLFGEDSKNVLKSIFSKVAKGILSSRPKLKKNLCIGCNLCGKICPAKAITIVDAKAVIQRDKCIRCFCCQEFCPKGAMKVHRTFIARLLEGGNRRSKE